MDPTSHHKPNPNPQKHRVPSKSELMSSAQVVAEAAKAGFHHESDKVDKGKVAGAAADLLGGASHYGKLEEKSFGKYVDKAETYLHQYHSSHAPTTTSGHHPAPTTASGHTPSTTTHSSSHSDGDGHSAGGYGDYMKMASDFLKKH